MVTGFPLGVAACAIWTLKEQRRLAVGADGYNRGAGALSVVTIIKVRKDDVARAQLSSVGKTRRDESDTVRVLIAIAWDSRGCQSWHSRKLGDNRLVPNVVCQSRAD